MLRRHRLLVVVLIPLLSIAGGLYAAHRFAVQRLQGALVEALGPRAQVGAIELGWAGVTVRDLRVVAGTGWPADEELRAREVRVRPDLLGALAGHWRIDRIDVTDARVVLLRTRDGRLRVLPSMLEARRPAPAASGAGAGAPRVLVDQVVLSGVQVDLFDASLGAPKPHRIQLTDLNATLETLAVPAFDMPMRVDIGATFKGPQRDGRLRLAGTLTPATKDAQLRADLQGVDLLALQPYLLKVADGGVRQGLLDLRLDATVRAQRLKAPGRIVLTGLELADGPGVLNRFAGLPRQAVLGALKSHDRIELNFTLEGRLDDPAFSINDSLARRFTTGLAEALGVSVEGVVEGVGRVLKGLLGR